MDITITQPDGTSLHMTGPLEDLIAVLRALGATSGTSSDDADDQVGDSSRPEYNPLRAVRRRGENTITIHAYRCDHVIPRSAQVGYQEGVTPQEYVEWLTSPGGLPEGAITTADCATARTVTQACDDADDLNDSQQPWGIVRSDYVGTMTVHNTKCPAYSNPHGHRLNGTYVSRQDASWAIRTGWPSFTEGDCSACGTDTTRTINQQPEIGDWSAFTRYGNTTIHRASCECEPEGRLFADAPGVTLAAFSLTIRNEGAPGIIGTADCCY